MIDLVTRIAASTPDSWKLFPSGSGCLEGCLTLAGCPSLACMGTITEILGGCCIVSALGLGGAAKDCGNEHKKAEIYAPKNPIVLTAAFDIERIENSLVKRILKYQVNTSPKLQERGSVCKYQPSCSEYAIHAIKKYGNTKGTIKAATRLLRCNPLSKGGYDPII